MGSLPLSSERCSTSDSVMVADIGFKKQLWALDPELDVVWNWAIGKWQIWRFPGQAGKKRKRWDDKAACMLTVETQQRTFRELGADVLLQLQKGDPRRYSLKQLVDYFDQMDENIRRAKEKRLRDLIGDITWENYDWMRGVLKIQVPKTYKVQRAIVGGM